MPVSQLDALRNGSTYAQGSREFRERDASGVVLYRTALPTGFYERPSSDDLAIQLQLNSGAAAQIDHGTRFSCETRVDNLAIAPMGVDLSYDMRGSAAFLGAVLPAHIFCDPFDDATSTLHPDLGWLHTSSFADEAIAALLRRVWKQGRSDVRMGRLLTDSVWTTLALLLQSRSLCREDAPHSADALVDQMCPGDWRVRRSLEQIDAHLRDDVGLDDLAREVGLSRRCYTEMFRTATGMSPHQWMIKRRIDKAADLLVRTKLSITAIAFETGFSSSQHLATTFWRKKGSTPSQFRRTKGNPSSSKN